VESIPLFDTNPLLNKDGGYQYQRRAELEPGHRDIPGRQGIDARNLEVPSGNGVGTARARL
jgi:hypothetical protein